MRDRNVRHESFGTNHSSSIAIQPIEYLGLLSHEPSRVRVEKRGTTRETSAVRRLERQWGILLALQASRTGLTSRDLLTRTGCSRSTLYRELGVLLATRVPLAKVKVNGEVRYRLGAQIPFATLAPSPLQVAALHLAREELGHLAGSSLVRELDALLGKLKPPERQRAFSFARAGSAERPEIIGVIDRAIETRARVRLEYRSVARRGGAAIVHVEPRMLHVADREPYFLGYCLERGGERTYKVGRVVRAELTGDSATHLSTEVTAQPFARSRKAWTGDAVSVRVRLDAEVAWLAPQYPLLADQRVVPDGGGAVVVEASVAGLPEALRWVLAWGGNAEVLEPPALRALVAAELGQALIKYAPAKAPKAVRSDSRPRSRVVSTKVRLERRRVGT